MQDAHLGFLINTVHTARGETGSTTALAPVSITSHMVAACSNTAAERVSRAAWCVQVELQADGVGDHVFLVRVAEAVGWPAVDDDLVQLLHLNRRGLAFARKVRDQLRGIVETRVWPLLALRHTRGTAAGRGDGDGGAKTARSSAHPRDHGGERPRSAQREREHREGHSDRRRRGDVAERNGHDDGGREREHRYRDRQAREGDRGTGRRRERSRSPRRGASERGGGSRSGERAREDRGPGNGQAAHRSERTREEAGDEGRQGRERMWREGVTSGAAECPDLRMPDQAAPASQLRRMRRAIALGYAPQIARRMDRNNGYRTLCAREESVACALAHYERILFPDGIRVRPVFADVGVWVCTVQVRWAGYVRMGCL